MHLKYILYTERVFFIDFPRKSQLLLLHRHLLLYNESCKKIILIDQMLKINLSPESLLFWATPSSSCQWLAILSELIIWVFVYRARFVDQPISVFQEHCINITLLRRFWSRFWSPVAGGGYNIAYTHLSLKEYLFLWKKNKVTDPRLFLKMKLVCRSWFRRWQIDCFIQEALKLVFSH